jgi:hypothetical protein
MRTKKIAVACIAALATLLAVQSAAAQGKLEGVWKVTEVNYIGKRAVTITAPQPSIWIFTKNYLSRVEVQNDRPRPDLPQKGATDAQNVETSTPSDAVAAIVGTYEIKGMTFTAEVIVGKNPTNKMAPFKFFTADYKIEGDTLFITIKATDAGPLSYSATYKLVRLE